MFEWLDCDVPAPWLADPQFAIERDNREVAKAPRPITSIGVTVPDPTDERFYGADKTPLPAWVTSFREHQWKAALEIVNAFNDGADVVWLNAPTGAGKTLIGEMVRRLMEAESFYVCSTKSLQDQFVRDFDYSRVLKGRGNYPTLAMPYPDYTTADCTKTGGSEEATCFWCPEIHNCPYERAKAAAIQAPVGVLNTSYLLTEGNYVGKTSGRKLNIIDECDVLEAELMNFVQYEVSERRLKGLGLQAPKKGVRKKTILDWLVSELKPAVQMHLKHLPISEDVKVIRERQGLSSLLNDTERIIDDLSTEIEAGLTEDDHTSNWVRDNDAGPMVLKPVRVGHYGSMIWGLADKWLCMSATIISTEEMNTSLGVTDLGLKSATVDVPMMFPVENRPIMVAPVARMSFKDKDKSYPLMLTAVKKVLELHPDERILVHTVSYDLSKYLMSHLRNPRCITYTSSADKEYALARYRKTPGAVLLAASMDRGVDLKHDECRVVVVAKVPFPSLGDRQVGMRLRSVGGQEWYNVQTIRKLVQMTGRGVRSEDDWCVTYIFDSLFMEKVYKAAKQLLPKWWLDAVEVVRARNYA
jgi:ATP-dependent DNA helicase DinG